MLAVGWLEVKLPEETDMYRHVMRVAHSVIAPAFSNEVIIPGVTTAKDVRWWTRQTVAELGLGKWFHPSVSTAREGVEDRLSGDMVIQRGDMLHTDFGILYFSLSTDVQHNAYVLRHGETDAPEGLRAGGLHPPPQHLALGGAEHHPYRPGVGEPGRALRPGGGGGAHGLMGGSGWWGVRSGST